jgi:hypothetical protein
MIGASKINEVDDLPKLRELINQEPNNHRVAETFKTSKGQQISPEMVRAVRKGKRWNTDTRSFLMKTEMQEQTNKQEKNKNRRYFKLKDKQMGEATFVSEYSVVNGVGVAVSTYNDWHGSDKKVELCEDAYNLGVVMFNFMHEMILKHKMVRDLIILEAVEADKE